IGQSCAKPPTAMGLWTWRPRPGPSSARLDAVGGGRARRPASPPTVARAAKPRRPGTERGDHMRHCTDILGEIEIRPSLNRAETAYLRAFAASRRWWRPQGPYHVPEPPHLEEH